MKGPLTRMAAAAHAPHPHAHAHDHAHDHAHAHTHGGHGFADAEAMSAVLDDPARDAWQRPDDVLAALDLAPTMTVAEVGAGTGYFAVRLARAVPQGHAVATDLEPAMVRHLTERARRENLTNLRAVQATPDHPGLEPRSMDRILVVNVWHHVADRVRSARQLSAALRPRGRLVIVDFALDAEHGPPAPMRLAPETLVAELARAGLEATLLNVAIPGQYIVAAHVSAPPR